MAEKLKEYTFESRRQPGRGYKYDYDYLLDGSPIRLRKAEDFPNAKPESFIALLRGEAGKRDLTVQVQMESEDTIVIQAIKKP